MNEESLSLSTLWFLVELEAAAAAGKKWLLLDFVEVGAKENPADYPLTAAAVAAAVAVPD